ncbi:hypothetical protein E1B28_001806 [Marasmius oreades]|uniref:Uncharacterized protein n=1 Tax=Marasmius oreades TaxID=181124 RepID=A0A9P8AG47_9AGAR|nr:uncharacterized protein E1B28_001806 [Marasmius oreades]KAG7100020.1 hypothetical protein E1B28_001806 [Marasmius oreades]
MSDEPTAVTTEVQEALDVHEPSLSKVPGSAPEGDDEGEESDTYDDFDAEDNKDNGEFAGAEDDDEDGDDGEDHEEERDVAKSNLTALLLNDPNAGGVTGNADEDEDDEDADSEEEYNEEQEEPEVVAVQANGNGKKRTIDDVNSDEVGVEADEREAAAKKVKA